MIQLARLDAIRQRARTNQAGNSNLFRKKNLLSCNVVFQNKNTPTEVKLSQFNTMHFVFIPV